ncbi:alcohol oxidase [Collybia nuda]|uniref:Alcohol oxidase n=1 Tax=Collybia nuda TaxID=64659 RepID=A0A9P5XZM9_9AGAR|nr:alcohol oxidase [Collybia nuda]
MPVVTFAEFSSFKFDYLIIGGGTSGLTLAARLSEDPRITVGVIEAGGDAFHHPQIDIPGMMGTLLGNPTYDWTFQSVPQIRANNRVVPQPRGKGLGGSSLLNYMGMFRPCKKEYDVLEEMGNKGWNWESLLKCMKKSETTLPSNLSPEDSKKYAVTVDFEHHGTQGPIVKSYPFRWTELHRLVIDTAETLGIPRRPDSGDGVTVGVSTVFGSVDSRTSVRSSAASGYYEPNATRPNLLVLTHAHVTKVILQADDSGSQRAIGVELSINGTRSSVVGVKKDIVLSAGSFQTPQLLELSGIGNPNILNKHGITPVINLPGVGENMQDHVSVLTIAEVDSSNETLETLSEPEQLKLHNELYKSQKGILAAVPAVAFLFASSGHLGIKENIAEWQAQADAHSKKTMTAISAPEVREGLKRQYEIQKRWFSDETQPQAEVTFVTGHLPAPGLSPAPGKRYASMYGVLLHPLTRGSVHIISSDPYAPPAIDPNYFANEADLDIFVHIMELTLKVYETPPFVDTFKGFVLPSPEVLGTDPAERKDRLKDFIRDTCGPVWHPVGTAAMLPRDQGGVVDSNLKVYGTTNLRVADLSILPLELSTHTQSAAYTVGEKAAEILKALA